MRLTPRQQRAVDSPAGEFVVKAGAGTGKTRVLIHKYLAVFNDLTGKGLTDAEACSSILTVTFTRRAAREMLERLRGSVDPGALKHARISTIDAFCSRFLRENAFRAGLDPSFRVLDGVEAKLLFRREGGRLLEEEGVPPLEVENSRQEFLNDVFALICDLKQRLISPEEFASGAGDSGALHRIVSMLYSLYEEKLFAQNLMDFGKLLFTVYRILENDRETLRRTRELFRYVLIDEYQDTNPGQVKLLRLISTPRNNYFAVGDDQQSIYGFRGAEPRHIMDLYSGVPEERKVFLNTNFRTPPPLPEVVNEIFSGLFKGYSDIESGCEGESVIEVFPADERKEEAEFIAEKTAGFIREGYSPGDIVILLRGVKNASDYEEALREAGILSVTVGGMGFYRQPEVKDLISIILASDNPYSDRELVRVFRSPAFGVPDSVLAAFASREKGEPLYSAMERSGDERVLRALGFIKMIRERRESMSLAGLIREIIRESGLLYRAAAAPGGMNSRRMSNLNKFISLARHFESGNIFTSLADFALYLRELEEAAVAEPEPRPRVPGVVHIMSIHQSKGLEFPVVFVSNVTPRNFPAPSRQERYHYLEEHGLIIRDKDKNSPYMRLLKERLYAEHQQEERRLLYVALTRTMKHLLVTGSRGARGRFSKFMYYFIEEEDSGIRVRENLVDKISLSGEVKNDSGPLSSLSSSRLLKKEDFLKNARSLGIPVYFEKTSPAEYTVTGIETYATCPYLYKLRYVMRVPEKPGYGGFSPAVFGTAVHRVLEEFYTRGGGSASGMRRQLISLLLASGVGEGEMKGDYIESVDQVISRVGADGFLPPKKDVLFVEQPFVMEFSGAFIKGTIDRVDKTPLRVVDYKTSAGSSVAPYALQLGIYSMALEKIFGLKGPGLFICHLRSGDMIETGIPGFLEMKLRSLISGLKLSNFPPRPGRNCQYCPYKGMCPVADPKPSLV